MACWKRLLSCAALGALFALPAQAQIGGRPIEAHAGAGISSFDARDFIKDSPIYTGSLGWRWMNHLSLEGSFTGVKTRLDRPGDIEHEWSYAALDARWNLRDPGERATPYLLTGFDWAARSTRSRACTAWEHPASARASSTTPSAARAPTCACRSATSCSARRARSRAVTTSP